MVQASKWISAKGDEPVTKVAVRTLKSRLEPVQAYLAAAANKYEQDVEYVHQLRVWTRRADAALEMYRELIPPWRVARIRKQLKRIRKATNEARDDDVFAKRLANDEDPAVDKLLTFVRGHRLEAQQAVRDIHQRLNKKKGRFGRHVEKLLKRVRLRGKRRKAKEPTYRNWAEVQLRPIVGAFLAQAEDDMKDARQLHEFRIKGKNLRYAMELFSSAFGSRLRKNAHPLLEALQDRLGEINDHATALVRIGRWIEENESPQRDEYLKRMLTGEQTRLEESSRDFSAWWSAEKRELLRAAFDNVLGDS